MTTWMALRQVALARMIKREHDGKNNEMPSNSAFEPVNASERIDALDIIRGFALLGIGLMNIEFFSRPLQDIAGPGIDPTMQGIDYAADAFIYFFVQSKFWILFSLLFGMGFAVMIERASCAGRPFVAPYLRRSLALLMIGTVHAVLVWAGDILVSYAIGAFILLLARQLRRAWRRRLDHAEAEPMPASRLAKWGAGLYAFPLVMMLIGGAIGSISGDAAIDPKTAQASAKALADYAAMRERADQTYSHGSYTEAVAQRVEDTAYQLSQMPAFCFFLLGMFLLGAALIRSGWLQDIQTHRQKFRTIRNIGLPLGFALMAVSVSIGTSMPMAGEFGLEQAIQMATYLFAGVVLALAYAATVVTLLETRMGPALQAWLAPTGRMALTNYLTHSVVFTLLFYGYGIGCWGDVGRAAQVLLLVSVYGLQMLFSRWWLARFRFGPMEWLWRAATYWQWPPMRLATAV